MNTRHAVVAYRLWSALRALPYGDADLETLQVVPNRRLGVAWRAWVCWCTRAIDRGSRLVSI